MLLLLGIDSQFAMTETFITAIIDSGVVPKEYTSPANKWKVTATCCLVCYLLGFVFITEGGLYWLNVVNGLSVGTTLFTIGCLEGVAVCIYGVDRFVEKCKEMVGPELSTYYRSTFTYFAFTWKWAVPTLSFVLVITSIVLSFTSDFSEYVCNDPGAESCEDADWGIGFGFMLCASSMAIIPAVAFRKWYLETYILSADAGDDATPYGVEMRSSSSA